LLLGRRCPSANVLDRNQRHSFPRVSASAHALLGGATFVAVVQATDDSPMMCDGRLVARGGV